jgi:hypothetical protein
VNKRKLLQKVLAGAANIRFGDVVALVEAFGFEQARVTGSHHLFVHPNIPQPLNLQKRKGKAKPYQVRQFLMLVEQYNLPLGDNP